MERIKKIFANSKCNREKEKPFVKKSFQEFLIHEIAEIKNKKE